LPVLGSMWYIRCMARSGDEVAGGDDKGDKANTFILVETGQK
jgi:hypothetical protein